MLTDENEDEDEHEQKLGPHDKDHARSAQSVVGVGLNLGVAYASHQAAGRLLRECGSTAIVGTATCALLIASALLLKNNLKKEKNSLLNRCKKKIYNLFALSAGVGAVNGATILRNASVSSGKLFVGAAVICAGTVVACKVYDDHKKSKEENEKKLREHFIRRSP